jgi:hypothetical protein
MFSPYYENQNTTLLGDDNLKAKRRMMKSQTKKFDPAKAKAKKAEASAVKDAKSAIAGVDVSSQYATITSQGQLAISLLDELKSLVSVKRLSTDSTFSSRILSAIARLDQIYNVIFSSLKSLMTTFNNLTPKQLNDMKNVLNMCENRMVDISRYIMNLPVGDPDQVRGRSDQEITINFGILVDTFDQIIDIEGENRAGEDLFTQLYNQYNFGQPTQYAINQIRSEVLARQEDGDDDTDSTYSPSTTATSTTDSGTYVAEDDDDDSDYQPSDAGMYGEGRYSRSHMSGGSPLCSGCSAYPFAYNTRSQKGSTWGL